MPGTTQILKGLMPMSLDDLRGKIDDLDAQILQLLLERARTAEGIGAAKEATGAPVYAAEREAQLISSLLNRDLAPLDADSVTAVFLSLIHI